MAKDNNLRDFLDGVASAIRTKKGTSGDINAQDFESEILSIDGGGGGNDVGWDISYEEYALALYYRFGKLAIFSNAWQDMKDSETVLFDIPLALAAPNQEMGGMNIDLYVGTNGQLQALYDACANGTIRPPIDNFSRDVYYVNNVATHYSGDANPLYNFGDFNADDSTAFFIGDLTPLSMGLGLVLAKIADVSIPNNNIVIQQGFEFENESGIIIPDSVTGIGDRTFEYWQSNNQPLVIPNSVTSIGDWAFANWEVNNQPLVIPDSVTSIGDWAFYNWTSNNQPLVIPNSVTSIGDYAFYYWTSNNQPLVIPNSVTSIGNDAFSDWRENNQPLVIPDSVTSIGDYAFAFWESNDKALVIPNSVTTIGEYAFGWWQPIPYVIIYATTPPTLANSNAFYNNSPNDNYIIYVPDESLNDYKTATQWSSIASRIKAISEL